MAEQGGYRKPSNPAPVSGPGSLSQRTDGGPGQPVREVPAAYYGERQEMRDIQGGAQMAQGSMPTGSPTMPSNGMTPPSAPMTPGQGVTPLTDPTERPDEPVTAGAALGPGPGTEALGLPSSNEDAQRLLKYLPAIMRQAETPDSGQQIKMLAQYLRGISNGQ
jgi:hypothetical protein